MPGRLLYKYIMKRISRISGLIFFGLLVTLAFLPASLFAQMTCTGNACPYLPFSTKDYDRISGEFQKQYTNKLFNDMAEAAVVANLAGPPVGTVNLSGFTVGSNVGVGYKEPTYVDVDVPGIATFKKVPSAGAAVNGRFFGGLNLGALLGMGYDPFNPRERNLIESILGRIDIYVSAFDHTQKYESGNSNKGGINASIFSRAIDVRIHLVEGNELIGGPMLRFLGVSAGAGYYRLRSSAEFRQDKSRVSTTTALGDVVWEGANRITWTSDIETYPVEVRTGLQVLYFFNITAGGGVAMSKGNMDFTMNRTGNAYFSSPQLSAAGIATPSAILGIGLAGHGDVPARLAFARAGVEINLTILKISIEALKTKNSTGGNVGVRLEF